MSFQEAESIDANHAGLGGVLREALEEAGYQRNPYQVYDNMDLDPLVGVLPKDGQPASRVDLLRHVSNHRRNLAAIPGEVVTFCRGHLQEGPVQASPAHGVFGRVQGLGSLVNAVTDPSSGLSLRNAEALVRDLVATVADSSTKLARQRTELSDRRLALYQMWCYPPEDSGDPFREIGTTREEAVNVLGLGYYAYEKPDAEVVRWAHTLPASVKARRPTAWDAGADRGNVYWRPGGKTYKLKEDAYGVMEVVHAPVHGADLTAPIEALL